MIKMNGKDKRNINNCQLFLWDISKVFCNFAYYKKNKN